MADFELGVTFDSGTASNFAAKPKEDDTPPPKVLVWHKLSTNGKYIPSVREGHSSVSKGLSVYVFGGIETAHVSKNCET